MTGFHVHGVRDYDGQPFDMYFDDGGMYAVHVVYGYRFGFFWD